MIRLAFAVLLAAGCLHCHNSKGGAFGASVTPRIIINGQATTPRMFSASASSAVNDGLGSLQYYISNISICQSVTLDGSGTSGSSGCVQLYDGPSDATLFPNTSSPDFVGMANHARNVGTASANAQGTGYGYIDLMDPNSRGTLQTNNTFTSKNVGSYSYGLIYWAYPVKVTATLTTAAGSNFLFTHDGNVLESTQGGTTTFASDLTVGPATEAVINLPTAGTWFKIQNPFTITSEDVSSGADFVLDLVLDPNGIITGYQDSVYGTPQLTDAANDGNIVGDYISVPLLDLSPVPHLESETTRVETYQGSITGNTNDRLDVRVELYSIAEDANHTIYGVSVTPLVNASTTVAFAGFGKAAFIETNADGSINLQDWNHTTFLANLQRQTTVGGQTAVTVGCTLSDSSTPVFAGCTTAIPVTLALTAIEEL